ncbi:tyrosine-type recombinase/integrase [Macrococcus equipercicus]|nr:tyrosine-type recombinase/integrase [Macrococcus equipercicus]UTH13169.1 tyrosine-type recombinase/integrase [Macrococcus equipercicus]
MSRKLIKQRSLNDSYTEAEEIVISAKSVMNLSEATMTSYHKAFVSMRKYFNDKDIFTITKSDAEDYVRYLLYDYKHYTDRKNKKGSKIGLAPSSVNTYIRLSKAIFNTLVECEYIDNNPFKHISLVKKQNERVKTVSKEDINKLLNGLEKNYYTEFRAYVIIHVLLDTMGRIGEVLELTKDDIDFDNQIIYFSKTKNNNYRYVNFSVKTKRLLKEYIDITSEFDNEYVFLNSYGKKLRPDSFRKTLKEFSRKLEINKEFSCHTFRHTAATEFLANGGSVRVLQKILGHSRITTTEIYTHVNEELIKKQHNQYNAVDSLIYSKKSISSMRRNKRK